MLTCAALAGCSIGDNPTITAGRQAVPKQVRVDWLGHECFLFTSSIGTTLLTNPYSPGTTSRSLPSNLKADVVLVSNQQPDANNTDALENSPAIFGGAMGVGSNNTAGIHIRGVPIYANPEKQDAANMNLVYTWRSDSMRFCFLGNIPRALTPTEASEIGAVDILFVPVGVPAGLTDEARRTIVQQLRPRVIIPMGRGTEFTAFGSSLGKTYNIQGPSVLLAPEALPAEPTVLIFGS